MSARPDQLTDGKEVCAIAVTYHPDAAFPERFIRILRQVGRLVIVDNGSSEAEVLLLKKFADNPLITLLPNFTNLGIASALNRGIYRASVLGFRWVLLLDQDSCVDDRMVQTLISVQAAFPDRDRLAVIGSGYRDADEASQEAADDGHDDGWEVAESVITSGSLIPLNVHTVIGPFREEFFIDYVDTEYCFRARAKGYQVIRTKRPIMRHGIGAISRHRVLWFHKWTFNHTADRRYYIARNDTVMLREYGHYVMGLWALKSLGRCVRLCKRIALYEESKVQKIMAVAQGWWDGIRGHMGPRPRGRRCKGDR
jgi:rhamnosyltransferase